MRLLSVTAGPKGTWTLEVEGRGGFLWLGKKKRTFIGDGVWWYEEPGWRAIRDGLEYELFDLLRASQLYEAIHGKEEA